MKRLTLPEVESIMERCNRQLLRPMLHRFGEFQVFDFGSFGDGAFDHIDRDLACELWHRGLLRMPFDHSLFTFKRFGIRFYLVAKQDACVEYDSKAETATVFAAITQRDDDEPRADAFVWFNVPDGTHVSAGATELSDIPDETAGSFREFTLSLIGLFINLCMSLNTKGVTQRHEPAPTKLNVKRARQGKPALSAVTYVDLSRMSTATSGHGSGSSKSMHLRRGHIRHLYDGSVTWVRDCIVKADGELKQRERYQLTRRPDHA